MVPPGQMCLGPPKGSAEGSTNIPPRFHRGSPSFVVSLVLWGRRFHRRFHQCSASVEGSTKVSRRLRNFRDLSGLLGQIRFVSERILRVFFPITSLYLSLSSFNFFAFFPSSVSFGVSSHSKGLGAEWHVWLLGFFAQMAFASWKVLWSVLQTVLHVRLRVSRGFWGKWLRLQTRFCGGFPQLFSTFVSPMAVLHKKFGEFRQLRFIYCTFISRSPPGVKVAWIADMSQPHKSNRPIMSLLLGYSLGLFSFPTHSPTKNGETWKKTTIWLTIYLEVYKYFSIYRENMYTSNSVVHV